MQDPENRLNAIPSGSMPMETKNRRAADPEDTIVDLEWLGPPIKLLETHEQLGGNGGAFCYVYV